jgi:type IV fimbrial biogenesis protein FimT
MSGRAMCGPPMRTRRGFSLVELMVVLAIGAVLLLVAAPSFATLLREQRLRTASGELFGAISLSRAQALARGGTVIVTPRDAARSDWSAGWIVFADRDGDGQPGPGDEVIAEHGPLPDGVTVAFAFTDRTPPWYIAYNGAGRSCGDTNAAAAHWGTLSLWNGSLVRRITINMLGRARLCDPARDASCAAPS